MVKKGTPLLRVDPTQIESATSIQEAGLRAVQSEVQNQVSALTTAENAINTARAALTTSQADLDRANIERNNCRDRTQTRHGPARSQHRLAPEITTRPRCASTPPRPPSTRAKARVEQAQVQVKDAQIRVEQAKTAIEAAKARAAQQQANLAQQSDLLRKTTQYATIDGVVGGPIVQVGTYALANFSSTQLMLIADMSTINVKVNVDETDIANVKLDQKVKVKVNALGETEIEGKVVEISQTAQDRSGADDRSNLIERLAGGEGFQSHHSPREYERGDSQPSASRACRRRRRSAPTAARTSSRSRFRPWSNAIPTRSKRDPAPDPTPAAARIRIRTRKTRSLSKASSSSRTTRPSSPGRDRDHRRKRHRDQERSERRPGDRHRAVSPTPHPQERPGDQTRRQEQKAGGQRRQREQVSANRCLEGNSK